jgi:hypothetical protein
MSRAIRRRKIVMNACERLQSSTPTSSSDIPALSQRIHQDPVQCVSNLDGCMGQQIENLDHEPEYGQRKRERERETERQMGRLCSVGQATRKLTQVQAFLQKHLELMAHFRGLHGVSAGDVMSVCFLLAGTRKFVLTSREHSEFCGAKSSLSFSNLI